MVMVPMSLVCPVLRTCLLASLTVTTEGTLPATGALRDAIPLCMLQEL